VTARPDLTGSEPAALPAGPADPRFARARVRDFVRRALADTWILALVGLLVAVGVGSGLLLPVDRAVAGLDLAEHAPQLSGFMDAADHMGQRALVLPVLFAVTALVAYRRRSWWPLLVTVGGTFLLNVVVGALKLLTDRPSPRTGGPELGQYGDLFPSGHAANVVFVYGLVAWMLVRDTRHGRRWAGWLAAAVAAATVVMAVISVYRDTHWFTDLVVGAIIGAVLVRWTMLADAFGDTPTTHAHLRVPDGDGAPGRPVTGAQAGPQHRALIGRSARAGDQAQ
jgi:membrane-associated phospholipid phosphatase